MSFAGGRPARPVFRRPFQPATLALLGVLLLAFFLRARRLGEQRVWWDEGFSVWLARFPLLDMLRETGNDVHPPLYFALLHLWRALSGDGEFGLRFLSALLGTLTVALTYVLGREMARTTLPRRSAEIAGLLAALFLAVSRFAIAWSQEIRMYALAALLAVLGVWAARRVWAGGGLRFQIAYVLAMAGGLLTIYLFFPVPLAVNLVWPLVWGAAADRRRELLRWAALQAAVLLLFVPWALYAAGGFLSTSSATPIALFDLLHIYWTVLTVGIPVDVAQFNRWTLPALAVLLAGVTALVAVAIRGLPAPDNRPQTTAPLSDGRGVSHRGGPSSILRRDLLLLLAVLLLPALIVYAISLPKQGFYAPPFNPRYLVIFASFYSILLAWGLVTAGQMLATWLGSGRTGERGGRGMRAAGWLAAAALGAFMLAMAWVGLRPYYPGRVLVDDYLSLVDTLDAYRQPGDAVVLYTDTDWPIFDYHYPGEWRGVPHLWQITPQVVDDFLAPIWDGAGGVWLVTTPYSAASDPERQLPAWLEAQAVATRAFNYEDMALTFYARTPERAAQVDALGPEAQPPRPLDVAVEGGRLTGFRHEARDFKSGDVIHLFLYGEGAPSVEVGLLDGAGKVWQATTVGLDGRSRVEVDLLVSPDTPPGDYRFFARDASGTPVPFGNMTIRQKQAELLTEADVAIPDRLDASFEQGIRLLGFALDAPVARAGETVGLTLYWQADAPLDQRYKVFTHVLGDVFNAGTGNFLWGQVDSEPAANTRPTTTWRSGEIIVDRYDIPIQADAPPGEYRVEIGLYDPLSGGRLPVLGEDGAPAADHVILTLIDVIQ